MRPDDLRLSSLRLIALRPDGLKLYTFGLPVGSRIDALRPDGLRHCNFGLSALRPHGSWLRCFRLRALRLSTAIMVLPLQNEPQVYLRHPPTRRARFGAHAAMVTVLAASVKVPEATV